MNEAVTAWLSRMRSRNVFMVAWPPSKVRSRNVFMVAWPPSKVRSRNVFMALWPNKIASLKIKDRRKSADDRQKYFFGGHDIRQKVLFAIYNDAYMSSKRFIRYLE